jgi:hypothetical protein
MRLSGRLFRYVLLASVLLNLGDAPYIDEIFDNFTAQQSGGSLVLTSYDENTQLPSPGKTSSAVFYGYLLVSALTLVASHESAAAVVCPAQTLPPEYLFSFSSLPPGRIDRPPRRNPDRT